MLPVRWASSVTSPPLSALGRTMPWTSAIADQVEIVLVIVAAERIDPQPPLRAAVARSGRCFRMSRAAAFCAGATLSSRSKMIASASLSSALAIFLLAVGGDEQPAARAGGHAGFFRSSAERVHSHTSLVALVEAAVRPGDDPGIGPRLAFAHRDAFAFAAQGVADEHRLGEDAACRSRGWRPACRAWCRRR